MSKFKVTLRRNGSAVGEMHYGSEAVAVTRAKEMKDATGCDVTVAPAKANPRRAVTRRRNGTGLRLASGSALEGSSEIGSAHDAALAARIRGELAEMVAKGMTPAQAVSAWMRKWEAMFLYEPPPAVVKASQRAFVQSLVPKRNGHRRNPESTTLWTVRVGSQEIGEFHAPSHLTAAIARTAARVAAEQGYTASMFRRFGSVSDGMHRHPVAQFLKNGHRCNPGCGCPKSNRRRRNGTTAGEAAASRSLAHRAAMLLTR